MDAPAANIAINGYGKSNSKLVMSLMSVVINSNIRFSKMMVVRKMLCAQMRMEDGYVL